jgi:hypothetical protein
MDTEEMLFLEESPPFLAPSRPLVGPYAGYAHGCLLYNSFFRQRPLEDAAGFQPLKELGYLASDGDNFAPGQRLRVLLPGRIAASLSDYDFANFVE